MKTVEITARSQAAATMGRAKSPAKTAAARQNGQKGGRPNLKIRIAARLHVEDVRSMGAMPSGQDAYDWPAESLPVVRGLSTDQIRERLAAEIERQAKR
jgi:hypothetical protein